MKNIKIYGLLLFALTVVFGCDPLEDEIEEIEDARFGLIVRDVEYTLTDEDYEAIDESCDCAGYKNLSEDDAKEHIPAFLSGKFPAFDNTSSALITYKTFNGSSPSLRDTLDPVTIAKEDYLALGFFEEVEDSVEVEGQDEKVWQVVDTLYYIEDIKEDLVTFAEYKYTDPSSGDFVDVTFNFEDDIVEMTERVAYTNQYGWMYVSVVDESLYRTYFEQSYNTMSESTAEERLPVFLKDSLRFAEEDDQVLIQYQKWENNEEETDLLHFTFDGSDWLLYGDVFQVTDVNLNFGLEDGVWVPDNTIKYTLSTEDFATIVASPATDNSDGLSNLGQYGSIHVGKWTAEQIVAELNKLMLESSLFIKEEGQKYVVSYAAWLDPGNGTGSQALIFDGENYVLQED